MRRSASGRTDWAAVRRSPVAGDQNAADQAAGAGNAGAVRRGLPPVPRHPLREVVTEESAAKLAFGKSLDGAPVGENDFASDSSVSFEVKLPEGISVFDLQVDAEVGADRDQVFRIVVTDRADGSSRGIPMRALLGDPQSHGLSDVQIRRAGVRLAFCRRTRTTSRRPRTKTRSRCRSTARTTSRSTTSSTLRVKYIRDDKFIYEHVLDDATRKKVDEAWTDLYASFEYHDHYVQLLAQHYKIDLKGKHISQLDEATLSCRSPPRRATTWRRTSRSTSA